MDKIEDFQKKRNINEVIKIAANSAIEKLKKYYKYMDTFVYTVSISMFYNLYIIKFSYYYIIFNFFIIFFFLVLDLRLLTIKIIIGKNDI